MTFAKDRKKTNIFIMEENLWKWAKYRSEVLGFKSVSEYVFQLIKTDKEKSENK